MPEYTYLCEPNNEEFETEHSIKIELEECPVCKEKSMENHKPKRLISGRTVGRVELSGAEYTAKINEDAQKLKKEVYNSEKLYSNIVGENRYNQIQSGLDAGRRNRR